MDEHIQGGVQTDALPVGHGQEAEAHPHVKPFTESTSTERARVLLGARGFLLLGPCTAPLVNHKNKKITTNSTNKNITLSKVDETNEPVDSYAAVSTWSEFITRSARKCQKLGAKHERMTLWMFALKNIYSLCSALGLHDPNACFYDTK